LLDLCVTSLFIWLKSFSRFFHFCQEYFCLNRNVGFHDGQGLTDLTEQLNHF
jgi:hypothetical protein